MTAAMISRVENRVPMVFFLPSLSFEPTCWEISTCPAEAKPVAMVVISMIICEEMVTADSPVLPTYCPTTIMSIME